MKSLFAVVLALMALTVPAMGMKHTRCSLANAMYNLGVPKADLSKWVCIAYRESSYDTFAVGPPNSDGSIDYGIFQINNKYWCKSSLIHSHNGCNVNCDSLLSNDISLSVKCALKVKKEQGWTAWTTWKYWNGNLRSIDDCFSCYDEYCNIL